ncbi:MAG: aldehyde dehydrogenase family protein, partial [Bacteroidales bacterium]|nr:aldehyde dehydrogenase family protein [Bacteroidales bacterium]
MSSTDKTAEHPALLQTRLLYIGGQWVDSHSRKRLRVINPATEDTITDVAFGDRTDCRQAIEAAAAALPAWMKLTAYDRAKVLKKTADLIRQRADTLARTLTMEQGKPLPEAKA